MTKVTLQQIPEQLIVAALSTESSTMEELECDYAMPVYRCQLMRGRSRYHVRKNLCIIHAMHYEEQFPNELYNSICVLLEHLEHR